MMSKSLIIYTALLVGGQPRERGREEECVIHYMVLSESVQCLPSQLIPTERREGGREGGRERGREGGRESFKEF